MSIAGLIYEKVIIKMLAQEYVAKSIKQRIEASVGLLTDYARGAISTVESKVRDIKSSALLIERILARKDPESKKILTDSLREQLSLIVTSLVQPNTNMRRILVAQNLLQSYLIALKGVPVSRNKDQSSSMSRIAKLFAPSVVGIDSEYAEFKSGNFTTATQLALFRFETECKALSGETEHGTDVVRKAFSGNASSNAQRHAKLASGLYQQLRNSLAHPADNGSRGEDYLAVSGCLAYLGSLISPTESYSEALTDRLPNEKELDGGALYDRKLHPRATKGRRATILYLLRMLDKGEDSTLIKSAEENLLEARVTYHEMKKFARAILKDRGVKVKKRDNPLTLLVNNASNSDLFGSRSEYNGWIASINSVAEIMKSGNLPDGFNGFLECYASLFFNTVERGLKPPAPVPNFQEGLDHAALTALRSGKSIGSILLNFTMEMEDRLNKFGSSLAPSPASGGRRVAQHLLSRDVIFKSPEVVERFKAVGVDERDLPVVSELLGHIMATLRSSWAHNLHLEHSPDRIGELMVAADLARRIVDIAVGVTPPPFASERNFTMREFALFSTLHPQVLYGVGKKVFLKQDDKAQGNAEASAILRNALLRHVPKEYGHPLATNDDRKIRKDRSVGFAQGLQKIFESDLLPKSDTSMGVVTRASLVSVLLNITEYLPFEHSLPMWEVFLADCR